MKNKAETIKNIISIMVSVVIVIVIITCCVSGLIDEAKSTTSNNLSSSTSISKFYGSINSNVYHYGSCRYVDQIKSYNLISFSSASDAKSKGHRPCKICKPPG
jgi:hypothetical protein